MTASTTKTTALLLITQYQYFTLQQYMIVKTTVSISFLQKKTISLCCTYRWDEVELYIMLFL